VPDDSEYHDEVARVRASLAECQRRLAAQEGIAVTVADLAVRHLLSLGLQLSAMEDFTDDPELRRRIEVAIQEADTAVAEVRRVIFDGEQGTDLDT
jgi:hypothetical protein